ncbi:MAG: histidinol-phosphate transaminase [Candidatus Omnitrophica bacterium]|nr:histidinol-phosphate transaminase [Candidatus Omnitrophota bacterium]
MKILPKKAISRLNPYKVCPPPLHGSATPRGTSQCMAKLDANESPYDLPAEIKRRVFNELKRLSFNRYPDPDALKLRTAFSKKVKLPLKWITAGNGSDELILYLTLTFAKRKVLFFSPTFAMYRVIGISCGAKAINIPLKTGFRLPLERILKQKDASIIFISSPNNPTGNCFSKDDILNIIKKTNAMVVLDEAYAEFCKDSFLPYLKRFKNLVILRTFSKAFGLAGMRVGFMISHPYIIREVNKVRLPYNLGLFSQVAGRVALEKSHFLTRSLRTIISERERVFENLCRLNGIYPYPSQANFILFKTCSCSDKLYSYLIKNGVLVRNLNGYGGLKNCLRVTIGTKMENDLFLERLRSYEKKKR